MGKPMEIGRQHNRQGHKVKCYNYNRFEHIAKDCWQLKKEKKPQGCFKCGVREYSREQSRSWVRLPLKGLF